MIYGIKDDKHKISEYDALDENENSDAPGSENQVWDKYTIAYKR